MNQVLGRLRKDPDERLAYDLIFERWLPDGDELLSAVATITGSTATVAQTDVSAFAVKVWIVGGTAGERATVTVRATTVQNRIKEGAFLLDIKNTA
jgi:hypothetical protein